MTRTKKLTMAVLATGILALAAITPLAAADPDHAREGPRDGAHSPPDGNRTDAHRGPPPEGNHSDARRGPPAGAPPRDCGQAPEPARCEEEQARMERERQLRERCAHPANESVAQRCREARAHAEQGMKARREAHALIMAIDAHERILGRIEYKMAKLEERKASGNLTANQTAEVDHRLAELGAMHDRQVAQLDRLHHRLEELKAKFAEAREHAQERRGRGEPSGDMPAEPQGEGSDDGAAAA